MDSKLSKFNTVSNIIDEALFRFTKAFFYHCFYATHRGGKPSGNVLLTGESRRI